MPARRPFPQTNHRQRLGDLQVSCAITKGKKTEILTKLTSELETSTAIVGFSFKGVSVQDLEKVRGDIPEDASLIIAKNTLMAKAASDVEGWAELGQTCKGSNAFLFLREDLKSGFKAVRDLQGNYKKAEYPVEFNGGCCDGQFLNVDDIKKLEKLPSKLELIAKIASCINQVPTRLAVSVKQVPTKLATGVKKISEGEVEPAEQAASA
jgi:large subunit ribosomal protein L10